MHPFRFGVQAAKAESGRAWRALARRAEELGYSTLFVPDHLDDQWGPLVSLTVAAEATERLRVGSLVFDNDYRHPVVLARELATLDLLSEGRLEIGLGAGWMTSDYEQAGLPFDEPAVRVARLGEAVRICKSLLASEAVAFEGRYYRVRGALGAPRPAQAPHPPIIIGGGSRRVLALAAAEADVVGVNVSLRAGYIGPEAVAEARAERFAQRVAWVRAAAGERFSSLELQCLTFVVEVGPARREAGERLAALFGAPAEDVLASPLVLVGTVEELEETLLERRERYGFSYWVVHEAELDAFAPVVARLAGR